MPPPDPEEERLLDEVQSCALSLDVARNKVNQPIKSVLLAERQQLMSDVHEARTACVQALVNWRAYRDGKVKGAGRRSGASFG
jgi:hypothetical protein